MALTQEEFLNCYIIQNHGRDAYLFQYIDYTEYSDVSPITKIKLQLIKEQFPNLIHTSCKQGVIISKSIYNIDYLDDNINLANILSYCCPITYRDIPIKYSYDIKVILKNNEKIINIISYICDNGCCDEHANNLSNKIKNILFNLDYIKDVLFIKNIHYNEEYYIKLLSNNDRCITKNELDEINNYIYNLGFSDKLQDYIEYNIDFHNPTHRGILIGLLTQSRYNLLEPFCPLQNYPTQSKIVNILTLKWENLIIDSFNMSKIKKS